MQHNADYYGLAPMMLQCIEEMAELTQALHKNWRMIAPGMGMRAAPVKTGREKVVGNVCEEIADVEICLEEIKYLLCG